MTRRPTEAVCKGYGRREAFAPQSTVVDTGASGWIAAATAAGPHPLSATMGDLLDIAAVVFRAERQLPQRRAGNRNVRYELVMPVSEPQTWKGRPQEILEELLGFLGMAEWQIQFVQRPRGAREFFRSPSVERRMSRIALLSGGLDSTGGVGAGLVLSSNTQLFLVLAAATAETFAAHEIVQFENGILASAIPPVPSLAMTKHAHPRLHSLFSALLRAITGEKWQVTNPLWQMTKRQSVAAMRDNLGAGQANALAAITQSCWNLSVPRVFGVASFKRRVKRPNEPCGVCVPCIIRRTALPKEAVTFDLRDSSIRNHPKLGALFLEYIEFVLAVRATSTEAEFRRVLPAEALDLIDDGFTDLQLLGGLLRSFAREFVETFELEA